MKTQHTPTLDDFNSQEWINFVEVVIKKVFGTKKNAAWRINRRIELEKTGQTQLFNKTWKILKRKNLCRTNGGFRSRFILVEVKMRKPKHTPTPWRAETQYPSHPDVGLERYIVFDQLVEKIDEAYKRALLTHQQWNDLYDLLKLAKGGD